VLVGLFFLGGVGEALVFPMTVVVNGLLGGQRFGCGSLGNCWPWAARLGMASRGCAEAVGVKLGWGAGSGSRCSCDGAR